MAKQLGLPTFYFTCRRKLDRCTATVENVEPCAVGIVPFKEHSFNNIFKAFDGSPSFETRGVFLNISKAFYKVWHEGLLFKLRSYGVQGCLHNIIKDFLKNRKQRVVLNGQNSFWENVNAGVPQGSILGPLLFLIYINDLPDGLNCVAKLFADDTSIFSSVSNITKSANDLNKDLCLINEWALQ